MQLNQMYTHYKNNPYKFLGIVLPYNEIVAASVETKEYKIVFDAETSTDTQLFAVEVFKVGDYYMSPKKELHVLYEALKPDAKEKLWIRPYDDFYSKVEVNGELKDRFAPSE